MTRHRLLMAGLVLAAGLLLALPALAKTVVGTAGPDVLRGGPGDDRLYGRGGDDRLYGLGGDDVLVGGPGRDLLVGGPGRDLLVGGPGGDRLVARDGARDTVRCGPGRDTAVVDARDRVSRDCETVLGPLSGRTFLLAGAGDIAGSGSGDEDTARLLDRLRPDVVFTTGDNAYPDGALEEFEKYYAPTWGRHKSRTRPSPGNHDYETDGASGYFRYFAAQAPGPYYSYDLGRWHAISLNSEISMEKGSPQYRWLERDLDASDAPCTLAYWHRPRYTAGRYRDFSSTAPLWELLYAEGAELVLNGHDHVYQRYRPMGPHGEADAARGIRQIVVGTGGRSLYELRSDPRREAAQDDVYGVLVVTLRPAGYDWRFAPVSGSFSDSGSASCR